MSTLQEAREWAQSIIDTIDNLAPDGARHNREMLQSLLDATQDAETTAQRTVERCAKIVDDAWEESISDVTEKIAHDIRSLSAPERVCAVVPFEDGADCYDEGEIWQGTCSICGEWIPTKAKYCQNCGARIEIRE